MPRRKFKDVRFRPESLEMVKVCNAIVADYQGQGLRLAAVIAATKPIAEYKLKLKGGAS